MHFVLAKTTVWANATVNLDIVKVLLRQGLYTVTDLHIEPIPEMLVYPVDSSIDLTTIPGYLRGYPMHTWQDYLYKFNSLGTLVYLCQVCPVGRDSRDPWETMFASYCVSL